MSLEFFDETLHLGLITARDAAFVPKGALARAVNARYRPGDFAIYPAEGRIQCGPSNGDDVTGLDNQANDAIQGLTSLEWDVGTEVTPGLVGEYQQLLFQETSGFAGLYTIVAAGDPKDVRMGRSYRRYLGFNSGVGRKPLNAVQFDNDWFLFGGGRGKVLQRQEGNGTVVLNHGMPKSTARIRCSQIVGTNTFTAGSWWYWFVYVNTEGVVPIEGGCDGWELPLPITNPSIGPPGVLPSYPLGWGSWWFGLAVTNGSQNIQSVDLHVPWESWTDTRGVVYPGWKDSPRPEWADKVYVYRGRTAGEAVAGANALFNAWPVGYKILELDVADLENEITNPLENLDGTGQLWLKLGTDDFTYNADTALSQEVMPGVTLRIDSEEFPLARNGYPPRASVATVFNESLVTNDEDDKGKTRFSFPQEAHAFPDLFFINHRTGQYDEVVAYVELGRVLGVYLRNGVERINYLPSATDFNFREGRLADQVLEMYGAVNSEAVAKFTHPSGRVMIAHVARNGIWVSDLFPEGTYEITRNLNWKSLVGDPNNLAGARLVNDPDEERLVFFFNSSGGVPNQMLYLHYNINHLQADRSFSITGPIERPGFAFASTLATLENGTRQVVTTDSVGRILYEGFGWSDESDAGGLTPMDVLTREIYVGGLTQHTDTEVLGVHVTPSGAGGNTTVRLITNPRDTVKHKLLSPERQLALLNLGGKAESSQIQIVGDHVTGRTGVGVNVLTHSWNPMGQAARRSAPVA